MLNNQDGRYVVEYIRYGVILYYPASTLTEARRFIDLYERMGEITTVGITTPEGESLPS